MKDNFLKQIARMLIFGLFVAGFSVNIEAASPAPTGTSTSTTCPDLVDMTKLSATTLSSTLAPNGCKNFTASICNIDACASKNSSPNSPTTFDTSVMQTLTGTDYTNTPNAISTYINTAKYLAAALKNYTTVIPKYTQLSFLYSALEQLVLDNLYANPSNATTAVLPFTVGLNLGANESNGVPSKNFPSGDFAPIGNLTNDQKGKLMLGYIQYEYNFMPSSSKEWILENVVSLILYSTLAKQMSNWNYYGWAWMVFAGKASYSDGKGGTVNLPNSPTKQNVLDFFSNSPYVYQNKDGSYKPSSQFQFENGTISDNVFNLLLTISNAQWSQVNTTDLYNVITSLDLNSVTSDFLSMQGEPATNLAWMPYMLSVMQAIATNNLYFNCSRDMGVMEGDTGAGQGIDGSIYYGLNVAQASPAKLSDKYAALLGTAVSSASGSNTSTSTTTTLPASLNDFTVSYMTGSFYPFLPASAAASPGNDATLGALQLSGLNGGASDMMSGSLWATSCANTSSAKVTSEQAAILSQIQIVTAQESPTGVVDGTGAPTMPGQTLQGASQNLITAAQAAVSQDPFKPYASKYTWVTTTSYPLQQDASMALTGANITVTPTVLNGFIPQTKTDTTSFATSDHLNMLTDVVTIMTQYNNCWGNLCFCANQGAVGGAAVASATCKISNLFTQDTCGMDIVDMPGKIVSEIKQQFDTPLGAAMMLLMGKQFIWDGIIKNIQAQFKAAKDADIAGEAAWRAKYPEMVKSSAAKAPATEDIDKAVQGASDGSGGYTPSDDIPSIDNLPSGPGGNIPTTGTGSTIQPPAADATFTDLQNSINSNIENLSTLDDTGLANMGKTITAAIEKVNAGEQITAEQKTALEDAKAKYNAEVESREGKGGYDPDNPGETSAEPIAIDI